MNRRMRFLAVVAVAAGCAGLPAAEPTTDPARSPTAAEVAPEIVATVNGAPLTREQLAGLTIGLYGERGLTALISQEVVRQEAAKLGIAVTAEEVEAYTAARVAEQMDAEARRMGLPDAAAVAKKTGESPEKIDELRRRSIARLKPFVGPELLARKLIAHLHPVTENDVRAEFDRRYGPKVQVLQIVLRSETEAVQVVQRLNQGADFAQMARDLSLDTVSKRKGGLMDPMGPGSPLADAAFKLKPNQIAGPIQIDERYHVIKLDKLIPAETKVYEQEKARLRAELVEERFLKERDKWLDQLLEKADVKRLL